MTSYFKKNFDLRQLDFLHENIEDDFLDLHQSNYEQYYYESSKEATNNNIVDLFDYLRDHKVISTYKKIENYDCNWYKIYDENCGKYKVQLNETKLTNIISYHNDKTDTSSNINLMSELLTANYHEIYPNSLSKNPDVLRSLENINLTDPNNYFYWTQSTESLTYTLYHLYQNNISLFIELVYDLIKNAEWVVISKVLFYMNKLNNRKLDNSKIWTLIVNDIISFWDIEINFISRTFSIWSKRNLPFDELKSEKGKNPERLKMSDALLAVKYLAVLIHFLKKIRWDYKVLPELYFTLPETMDTLTITMKEVLKKFDKQDHSKDVFNYGNLFNVASLLKILSSQLCLKVRSYSDKDKQWMMSLRQAISNGDYRFKNTTVSSFKITFNTRK